MRGARAYSAIGVGLLLASSLALTGSTNAQDDEGAGCACTGIGVRGSLASGVPAVIGRVIASRELPGSAIVYDARVERSFNARLGRRLRLRVIGGECGLEPAVGERFGALLTRRRHLWTSNGCLGISPKRLLRAAYPFPRARGTGSLAYLGYGRYSAAHVMGLGYRGRPIGYGYGPRRGFVADASVCPGEQVVAELVEGSGPSRLIKRRVEDLRVVGRRRIPRGPSELHCRDREAREVFLFQWDADPARITRVADGVMRPFFRGWTEDVTYAADHAYVAAENDHELLELDLDTGARRRVGVRTRGYSGPWEVSPDGSALATVEYFLEDLRRPSRLVVVEEISGPTPQVRSVPLKPEAVGSALWIGPDRLMYLPAGEIKPVMRLYDRLLNQLADFHPTTADWLGLLDGELVGGGRRGLLRFDFASGRPERIGRVPRDVRGPLVLVPGRPEITPGRQAPVIGKAHLGRPK